MNNRFGFQNYSIHKKFFKLFGQDFRVYGPDGQLILFSKLQAFKLREDITIYSDTEMTQPLLSIKARKIIDFSAAYDVFDLSDGSKIGALRRKGLKSLVKDEWIIMDAEDREIGKVEEDSMALALVRRFLFDYLPQQFHVMIGQSLVAKFKQNFNPFLLKLKLDFSPNVNQLLDTRMGIAAGILMCAIDRKQG